MSKVRIEAFMWVSHQAFIQNIMKHVKSLNQAFGNQFHDKNPAKNDVSLNSFNNVF